MTPPPILIHATCVLIEGKGILLRGVSGQGKSDLALRLMDRGAKLVSDDQVRVELKDGALIARPPQPIEGLMEVRGVGIVTVPTAPEARLHALFDLVAPEDVPRLPEAETETLLEDCALPRWRISAREPSAPLKIALLCDAAGRIGSRQE